MKNKNGRPRKSALNQAAAGNKNGRSKRNLKATRNEAAASNANEDRLSNLPNDLLLNILERVETLDAIRTCILSRQMLKLPTMLSRLYLTPSLKGVFRTNHAVAYVTDNILSTRSPEVTISELKIRFLLLPNDSLIIGRSVARAMATQKVAAAEFEIVTKKRYSLCSSADLLQFGKQFNDLFGACPRAFAGLTSLWLQNMRFGELDIPNILSTCKLLEYLRLSHCDSGVHAVLQVEHDQLVELEVDQGKFERVELICLPKLQRMTYDNWFSSQDPLYFGFVPQLSKLSLIKTRIRSDKTLELSQLLANVPSIDYLRLDFRSEKIWILPECPKLLKPVLNKLQHVNLDHLPEGCDLAWTMFILEAAPSLKELCITVWDHWCIMITNKELRKKYCFCEKADVKWKPYAPDFKHKNLAKLTIYGFQPDDNFMRYIRCVAEHAVNITEISLYDRKVCGRCGDLDPEIKDSVCPSRYPPTAEERKQITEELGLSSVAVVHFRS
ncbi:putative F-box/FBD/LRR-repeat protein At4g00315 [Hordeum vulgare subsp. vulgare]|uniref:F-box domain-containing protein n=1 Tax=Hordeum vulgare subsp. vulgare TaxID=112509 RepID=A0A8I7BCM0_HORVV|nr:putative F-box/FBD/LRR-repeat protein At4g00315 [Hordeum vulgare subsp. vulgare]